MSNDEIIRIIELYKKDSNIINDEEIIDTYAKISDDTLLLYDLLNKIDSKEKAIDEYKKIKNKE